MGPGGSRIARRPRAVWVTTSVILGALAFGIFQLNANGLSNEDSFTTTSRRSPQRRPSRGTSPAGAGNPVVLLTDSEATDEVERRSATSRASCRAVCR